MNKLITTDTGGFPLVLDDIRFMQDAWRDCFDAIYAEFGSTPATALIVSGIVQSDGGTNWDYTDGYAYMNGEILAYTAASVVKPAGGEAHYLDLDESWDAAGNKTFLVGGPYDTYRVKKAVINNYTIGTQPTNSILYSDIVARRYEDLRASETNDRLEALQEAWHTGSVAPADRLEVGTGITIGTDGCHIKRVHGVVYIRCHLSIADMATYSTIFQLNTTADKPAQDVNYPLSREGGGIENDCYLRITAAGNASIETDATTAATSGTFQFQLSYAT